jgi:hypothetical protein
MKIKGLGLELKKYFKLKKYFVIEIYDFLVKSYFLPFYYKGPKDV